MDKSEIPDYRPCEEEESLPIIHDQWCLLLRNRTRTGQTYHDSRGMLRIFENAQVWYGLGPAHCQRANFRELTEKM